MAHLLVVGGAGYIGSHMVKHLVEAGERVTVLDDLSTGHRDAVRGAELVEGSIGDSSVVKKVLEAKPDVVLHFASFIQVGESVREPAKYYRNNFANTLILLEGMRQQGLNKFVFSSSAAVYGNVEPKPITESAPCAPVNPYGWSKWMVEQVLLDLDRAYGLRSVSLRYFNAAGADPSGELGERHEPESHLIPLVLQTASGRIPHVKVFGRDYPTRDGTCVRDYIHVSDLCAAHLQAIQHLLAGGPTRIYNLGNGSGFSVQQVIDAARKVTGKNIPVEDAPRRAGDPPMLVADSTLIRKELGWTPRYADLDRIIEHAWQWEKAVTGKP
jgi:UDP-glucose 4-epimerase